MVRSISTNALVPLARSTTPSGTRFPAGVGWATSTCQSAKWTACALWKAPP